MCGSERLTGRGWGSSLSGETTDGLAMVYWNGRGLMEVPRMLMAVAGKFPTKRDEKRQVPPAFDPNASLARSSTQELHTSVVAAGARAGAADADAAGDDAILLPARYCCTSCRAPTWRSSVLLQFRHSSCVQPLMIH